LKRNPNAPNRVADDLARLYQIAVQVARTVDLDKALELALEALREAFPTSRIGIGLVDDKTGHLLMRAWLGYSPDPTGCLDVKIGQGIMGWVAEHGQASCVGDVHTDPRYIELDPSVESELCVPLIEGGRTIGVINLESAAPNAYGPEEQRFLETLAPLLAISIANARLLQAVRQSEEKYRLLYDEAPDGYQTLDEDGHIIEVNPTWLNMLGYAQEQVLGRLFEDFLTGESLVAFKRTFPRLKELGRIANLEFSMIGQDGKTVPVMVSGLVFRDEVGHFLRIHCTVRDITELRQAEQALHERRRTMHLLISSMPNLLCVTDAGDCLSSFYAPPGFPNILASPEVGKPLAEVLPSGMAEQVADALARARESGKTSAFEHTLTSDGEAAYFGVRVSPIQGSHDMLMVVDNITERVRAEEALRESEHRYRQVVNSIDQYLYSFKVAPDGSLTDPFITPTVTRFTGRPPEEHRADPDLWVQAIHPDDRDRAAESLADTLKHGRNTDYTYRVVDVYGIERWVRDEVHVTCDENGRAVRIDGVVSDITQRKLAQDALEERNRELRSANERLSELDRLKSRFIANMSHELRTPLNSIIGLAQILADGLIGELDEQQREFAEDIHSSGQHLLSLINDILDMSKIEAGQMDIHPQPFDFAELAAEAVDTVQTMIERKGQHLSLEVEPGLSLNADRFRIKQVLLNLLSNAHKFTPEGGSIAFRASALEDGSALLVEVGDTGIGITPDDIDLLFQEFRQADETTTREVEGTGLGLAISRHLVEMHGGTIWVESQAGEGSTFSLLLPLEGPSVEPPRIIPESELRTTPSGESQRLVLVVEDDRRFANLLTFHFNREGYDVAQLFSGREVVEHVRALKPCLISLDLRLPHTDGLQILHRLKSDPETAPIPIIIISAIDETEAGLALGADGYIVKPLDREQLSRLLAGLQRGGKPPEDSDG
jgi:PAS domain S-box-containing protein